MDNGFEQNPEQRAKRNVEYENKRQGSKHFLDGYNCEICRNKGYTMSAVEYCGNWEERQKECSCMKIRKTLLDLKKSGLGEFVKDFSLEKFKAEKPFQKKMLSMAQRYLESGEERWFCLFGASGCGKTMLCSAVAIELAKRGKEMKYFLWREESRAIKIDNRDGGDLINKYKDVDVLYIDDLFKSGTGEHAYQKPTIADVGIAFEIINSRLMNKKITIISSENTIDQLYDIDCAVAGRIKQMCGEEFMLNISKGEGKDFRKGESE